MGQDTNARSGSIRMTSIEPFDRSRRYFAAVAPP